MTAMAVLFPIVLFCVVSAFNGFEVQLATLCTCTARARQRGREGEKSNDTYRNNSFKRCHLLPPTTIFQRRSITAQIYAISLRCHFIIHTIFASVQLNIVVGIVFSAKRASRNKMKRCAMGCGKRGLNGFMVLEKF